MVFLQRFGRLPRKENRIFFHPQLLCIGCGFDSPQSIVREGHGQKDRELLCVGVGFVKIVARPRRGERTDRPKTWTLYWELPRQGGRRQQRTETFHGSREEAEKRW